LPPLCFKLSNKTLWNCPNLISSAKLTTAPTYCVSIPQDNISSGKVPKALPTSIIEALATLGT